MKTILKEAWNQVLDEAKAKALVEPCLAKLLEDCILRHDHLEEAVTSVLAERLGDSWLSPASIRTVLYELLVEDNTLGDAMYVDLDTTYKLDPACLSRLHVLLFYKGYHAIQNHRLAHALWEKKREDIALYLQHRASVVWGVDIHPGATLGEGIYCDHATGIVIGETAIIGSNVMILHDVTLGADGKTTNGRRHPKVEDGVRLYAGSKVIGPLTIGKDAKVGAGSIVLQDIPPRCTAVGIPARIICKALPICVPPQVCTTNMLPA